MLELDDIQHILLTRTARTGGPIRISVVSSARGWTCLAVRYPRKGGYGTGSPGIGRDGDAMGDRGLYLEWSSGARRG